MHPAVIPHSARIAERPYQHANWDSGHSHLLDKICFENITTLCVDAISKEMRADHDMPIVANYAYRRARCVEDDMLRIYLKGFSYFTGPNLSGENYQR